MTQFMLKFRTLLCLMPLMFFSHNSIAQASMCNEKISQLNSDLQSILRKTPAMPPLTQIYVPLRDLYEQAKTARDVGNYSDCVKKAELALEHSRAYAR